MKKIKKLTLEQESKMIDVREFWLDYFFSCKNFTNKKLASASIYWLYGLSTLKKPIIIYTDSPLASQYAITICKYIFQFLTKDQVVNQVQDQVQDQVESPVINRVFNQVRIQVRNQVVNQVQDQVESPVINRVFNQVRNQVESQIFNPVRDQVQVKDQVFDHVESLIFNPVRDQVRDQVSNPVQSQVVDQVSNQFIGQIIDQVSNQVFNQVEKKYYTFSSFGNISDLGWISFYDYFTQIGVFTHENFNKYKKLLLSGIYNMIQLDGLCVVSNMPDIIKKDQRNVLHCDNGPSIHFKDGYELFYWHGICVPKTWILDKHNITKQDFVSEKNAEKKRCLKEILGNETLIKLLDVEIIDEDIDSFGYPIKLHRTKTKDKLIDEFIYFLNVIDPSTGREYYLCVPGCSNVWKAKSWTFQNQKIEIRHGDVGLLNLKKEFDQPIYES